MVESAGAGAIGPGAPQAIDEAMRTEHPAATASGQAALVTEEDVASPAERSFMLWLTNISHGVNHFQGQSTSFLISTAVKESLGFGPFEIGVITGVQNLVGQAGQGVYGFLTPFARRTRILGIGNLILAAGTFFTSLIPSFYGLVGTRALQSAGSSAQHPMGSSILASYFPTRRGTILALNSTIASIGSLIGPIVVGLMLHFLGWRAIFTLLAVLSLAVAVPYFLVRERGVRTGATGTTRKAKLAQSKESYLRVLRNRNFVAISLVMMVGAAGQGAINVAFISPHLRTDLALSTALAGTAITVMQAGGLFGPLTFGWLSDRLSRKNVLQSSLLLSAVMSVILAHTGAILPLLFLVLLIYGASTYSRNSLTQAMIADSVGEADFDAGFSAYNFIGFVSAPIWALIVGFLVETHGFTFTWTALALSYIAGSLVLLLAQDTRQPA
jgi:MFS family permease